MRRSLLALLLAVGLTLAAAPLALADGDEEKGRSGDRGKGRDGDDARDADRHGKPAFAKRGDRWIFHNDQIAVWFNAGKEKAKPDLRVAFNGTDDERAGYRVQILKLCEVPVNSSECSGKYPRVNLAKSDDWNVVTEETNESLKLTMVRAESQGIVTLVWYLNKTSAAVKFDLKVDNWRWENASNVLMLDMKVVGKNLKNATGANVTIEDSGYIGWAPTAQATYGVNDTRTLNVTAFMKDKDDHDDDDDRESGGHLLLVFHGAGGYKALDYDPVFGVMGASSSPVGLVPALGVVAGLAVVAGAALVLRRKR